MALVDCVGPQNTAALWDQIVQLGEITGSAGSAASGAQIWRRAEESQCLSKLPGYYRQWISLLRSVCERDPVRMEQLAESLLEYPDKTVRQIEYLVLASVTGAIAQGKMQQARTTLNEAFTAIAPDRQRLPWFQLVRSIAPK